MRAPIGDWLLDAMILLLATAGTYLTAQADRPVTSVLIYLTGVIFIGARSGLFRGVAAALVASFIYNFFLSEPRFRLGVTSVDELVPLIAFNLSAFISGGLAGRLQDAARAARAAQARNALLLAISDELQRAVSVEDVAQIGFKAMPRHGIGLTSIGIWRDRPGSTAECQDKTLVPLAGKDTPRDASELHAVDLIGSRGELGRVMFRSPDLRDKHELVDLKAVANLLAMAIDRCLLLEQLSETMAMKRSEELKDALLSSVSHDLRTPLTAIEAAATSLRSFRANLSADQQDEMLSTISAQCEKLNRYTANLLDMGRIQAGIEPMQLTQVDVVEILGVALGSTRARFPEQQFVKQVETAAALVHANAPMLEQVCVNVLENSVVHGGAGQPISIALGPSGVGYALQVNDQGPGIPEEERPRVFERFYRGGHGSKREGSGLGLYIARGFIEAFGGTITLESSPQGGATVAIWLPAIAA
jgi:two-component system sensor histidine kinase KdpD